MGIWRLVFRRPDLSKISNPRVALEKIWLRTSNQ